MAISKKQANKIAELINATTVWYTMVRDEINTNPKYDLETINRWMRTHDEAANELNTILGVTAVQPYNVPRLGGV